MLRLGTLLAVLVLLPATSAHTQTGPALTHLSVRPVELEAGANASFAIETGEGPWLAGMVFVTYVQFVNDARHIRYELVYAETDVIANWTFEGEERHRASVAIPFDEGPYEIRLTNLAAATTRLLFNFDQTCNCTFKPVPLDESWVVFDYRMRRGHSYRLGFPLVQSWTVEGVLATQSGTNGHYPQDFAILEERTAAGPEWLNFTITPKVDQRYILFLTAHEGSPAAPNPNVYVSLTPLLEEEKADSPGAAWALAPLALGLGAAWRPRS